MYSWQQYWQPRSEWWMTPSEWVILDTARDKAMTAEWWDKSRLTWYPTIIRVYTSVTRNKYANFRSGSFKYVQSETRTCFGLAISSSLIRFGATAYEWREYVVFSNRFFTFTSLFDLRSSVKSVSLPTTIPYCFLSRSLSLRVPTRGSSLRISSTNFKTMASLLLRFLVLLNLL